MNTGGRHIIETLRDRIVEDGDCLRWTGGCSGGHPSIYEGRKTRLVRRLLWEEGRGPIPPGKVVLCTCGTPKCVNIDHCKAVTRSGIGKDAARRGAFSSPVRAAKIAEAKRKESLVSQDDVRRIRESDEPTYVLAARHGICASTVHAYKTGARRREYSGNVWAGLGV